MATYPGSNKTFAARSNGQVIDASHVGDLQDEVAAIEDGLLNGTARLNSSGSTMVSLTVTGTVTLPPPDAVRLQLDAVQTVALNTTTAIAWSSQVFMTNSLLHSTTTNPTRVTPQSTGLYWCRAQLRGQNAASSGPLLVIIRDSSGGSIGITRVVGSSGLQTVVAEGIKRFDSTGGYVRAVYNDASATNSLAVAETWFEVVKL